ncbi:MAG: hypothetical protein RSC92_05750 [Clostridia bacterium]
MNEDFMNFINSSTSVNYFNNIYITNLEKIELSIPETYKKDCLISKELHNFKNTITHKKYILTGKNLIQILNNEKQKYKSQIILPIIVDNILYGYFICISVNIIFKKVHLKYAKTTLYFIEKFIKKYNKQS